MQNAGFDLSLRDWPAKGGTGGHRSTVLLLFGQIHTNLSVRGVASLLLFSGSRGGIKMTYCDVAPCSHTEIDRHFTGAYYLDQGDQAPLKYWSISTRIHNPVSQKSVTMILMTMRT
jgi:hypothetical protein